MCVYHWSRRLPLSSHQCAAKLLGVRDPEAAYDRLSLQRWKDGLELELHASGLPNAIQELTREMVNRARIKALLSEADTISKHLKELRGVQGCVPLLYTPYSFKLTPCRRKLLEARRTKDDYDAAKISYGQAREQFQVVLDIWKNQEYVQIQDNRQLLERASTLISRKAEEFITKAIENTLKDCKLGNIHSVDGNHGRLASTDEKQVRPKNSFVHLC